MKRRLWYTLWFSLLVLTGPLTVFANPPIVPTGKPHPPFSPGPRYSYPHGNRGYGYGSGIGIGIGTGYGGGGYGGYGFGSPFYGRGFGPGFGFGPPPVYNGFYSNGLPLNGPPIPTGHSIPGVFGGADPTWGTPPFLFGGVSAYVPLDGPREPQYTRNRLHNPLAQPSTTTRIMLNRPSLDDGPGIPEQRSILIEITVPGEESLVYIEGTLTQQKGLIRRFTSPTLPTGEIYTYQVRVETPVDGRIVTHEKKASAYAGQTIELSFR